MGKGELWLEKFAQFSDTDLFIHLLSWISPPTLCMKSWTHKQRPARERTLDTIDLMQPTKTDIGWIWGCSSVKFLNKLILPPISYFNKTRSRYKITFQFPTQSKGQTSMSCLLTVTIDVMKHSYICHDCMRRQIITYIVVKSDEELKSWL